jgi:pimeloyl-ACP methyl ester carboxylesterase
VSGRQDKDRPATAYGLVLHRMLRGGSLALACLLACCSSEAAAVPYSQTKPPPSGPARWVIVIHAGGWKLVGRGMTGLEQPEVDRLHGWGFGTVNIDYRRGAAGLTDVLRFERRLRRKVGPHTPICLDGASAGAHLALMAALRRPDIACVVARAAPTLLAKLHGSLLRDAHRSFDRHGGLARWSPARYRLTIPLLIAHGMDDPYVPYDQAQVMRRNATRARLFPLRPGTEPWVHTSVAGQDLKKLYRVEQSFLTHAAGNQSATRSSPQRSRPRRR